MNQNLNTMNIDDALSATLKQAEQDKMFTESTWKEMETKTLQEVMEKQKFLQDKLLKVPQDLSEREERLLFKEIWPLIHERGWSCYKVKNKKETSFRFFPETYSSDLPGLVPGTQYMHESGVIKTCFVLYPEFYEYGISLVKASKEFEGDIPSVDSIVSEVSSKRSNKKRSRGKSGDNLDMDASKDPKQDDILSGDIEVPKRAKRAGSVTSSKTSKRISPAAEASASAASSDSAGDGDDSGAEPYKDIVAMSDDEDPVRIEEEEQQHKKDKRKTKKKKTEKKKKKLPTSDTLSEIDSEDSLGGEVDTLMDKVRTEKSLRETPITFKNLHPWMQEYKGWTVKNGKGLVDWFYVAPNIEMGRNAPAGKLGVDWVSSQNELVQLVKSDEELLEEFLDFRDVFLYNLDASTRPGSLLPKYDSNGDSGREEPLPQEGKKQKPSVVGSKPVKSVKSSSMGKPVSDISTLFRGWTFALLGTCSFSATQLDEFGADATDVLSKGISDYPVLDDPASVVIAFPSIIGTLLHYSVLARGKRVLHPSFIIDCMKFASVLDYSAYELPSGMDLYTPIYLPKRSHLDFSLNVLLSLENPYERLFMNQKAFVIDTRDDKEVEVLFGIAGGTVTESFDGKPAFVLCDADDLSGTCKNAIQQAYHEGIPVYSFDFLFQSLVRGHILNEAERKDYVLGKLNDETKHRNQEESRVVGNQLETASPAIEEKLKPVPSSSPSGQELKPPTGPTTLDKNNEKNKEWANVPVEGPSATVEQGVDIKTDTKQEGVEQKETDVGTSKPARGSNGAKSVESKRTSVDRIENNLSGRSEYDYFNPKGDFYPSYGSQAQTWTDANKYPYLRNLYSRIPIGSYIFIRWAQSIGRHPRVGKLLEVREGYIRFQVCDTRLQDRVYYISPLDEFIETRTRLVVGAVITGTPARNSQFTEIKGRNKKGSTRIPRLKVGFKDNFFIIDEESK